MPVSAPDGPPGMGPWLLVEQHRCKVFSSPKPHVSLRKSCDVTIGVSGACGRDTLARVCDLRPPGVFAVLRGGCGWRGPGRGGC